MRERVNRRKTRRAGGEKGDWEKVMGIAGRGEY